MGRQERSDEVRKQVVTTALKLFLEKGYAETTLREISASAGVSYGSIYHHFSDKEGIFLELVLDGFERTQLLADDELSSQQSAYLRLALKWAGLIQAASANLRVAELLAVAYGSWKITRVLMEVSTARHRDWLKSELPDWSDSQFMAASYVLKGAVSSVIDERIHLDQLTTKERIAAVLSAALPGFGASPEATRRVMQKVLRTVERLPLTTLK